MDGSSRRRVLVTCGFACLIAVAFVAPACGGAIDNELNQKGGSSGTSGSPTSTASSTPTSQPTSLPTPTPVPQPTSSPTPVNCNIRFKQDVMDVFEKTGCTDGVCHGGDTARNQPSINANDAQLAYKNLITFTLSTGKPYIQVGDRNLDDSSIDCNLRGTCGLAMPIGTKLTTAQLDLVDRWVMCGAAFP